MIHLIDIKYQTQHNTNNRLKNLKRKMTRIRWAEISLWMADPLSFTWRQIETATKDSRSTLNSWWSQFVMMNFNCAAFADSKAKSSIPWANDFFVA